MPRKVISTKRSSERSSPARPSSTCCSAKRSRRQVAWRASRRGGCWRSRGPGRWPARGGGGAGRRAVEGGGVWVGGAGAGALAYSRAGLNVGKHVLVYDLGGGTFDLAVLDNEGESFHVAMEPKGMERCGGDDFDHALYHHCDEIVRKELGRPISLTGAVDLNFLRECRRRKEGLTYQGRGKLGDYLPSEGVPVLFEHEVDRQTFEGLIGEYVETSTRLTEEILKQADTRGHEVDTAVLVGGSSRVPLVMRALKGTLPVEPGR